MSVAEAFDVIASSWMTKLPSLGFGNIFTASIVCLVPPVWFGLACLKPCVPKLVAQTASGEPLNVVLAHTEVGAGPEPPINNTLPAMITLPEGTAGEPLIVHDDAVPQLKMYWSKPPADGNVFTTRYVMFNVACALSHPPVPVRFTFRIAEVPDEPLVKVGFDEVGLAVIDHPGAEVKSHT